MKGPKGPLLRTVAMVLLALLVVWLPITILAGLAQSLQTLAGGWGFPLFLVLLGSLGWLAWTTWKGSQPLGLPRRFQTPNRSVPIAFGSKREAAEGHLDSIEQQLELVRDQIMRQVLEREHQQVAGELERGDLVVVVFGTGSSGKTSLIRALLGEMVGQVEPAMGSTHTSHTYRFPIGGLPRGVRLVDTPGILESGTQGKQREDLARRQAIQADLLLFVVDGDLRSSELRMVHLLLSLGKRLLLVLNKCDLLGERQEERLLQVLRQRCTPPMPPEDVIAVSSAPPALPTSPGVSPPPIPEVQSLVRRLAQVLRLEGDELMADNILLQSRHLSIDTEAVLTSQRQRDSRIIIERYAWIGGGIIALTPLPGLDLLGAAAVNAQMVLELGRVYGVQLGKEQGRELALAVGRTITGLGLVKGGTMVVTAALSAAWPALVVAKALQGVSAAWLTRVAGASLADYFSHNQDWGDGGMAAAIRKHYDLNRRQSQLNDFLTMAVERIVEPLQRRLQGLPPAQKPASAPAPVQSGDPG